MYNAAMATPDDKKDDSQSKFDESLDANNPNIKFNQEDIEIEYE